MGDCLEDYHAAFLLSRKSLVTMFIHVDYEASLLFTGSDIMLGKGKGNARTEQALSSLRAAASVCCELPDLIETLDMSQRQLEDDRGCALWNVFLPLALWGGLGRNAEVV